MDLALLMAWILKSRFSGGECLSLLFFLDSQKPNFQEIANENVEYDPNDGLDYSSCHCCLNGEHHFHPTKNCCVYDAWNFHHSGSLLIDFDFGPFFSKRLRAYPNKLQNRH